MIGIKASRLPEDMLFELEVGERAYKEWENEAVLNFGAPEFTMWPLYPPDSWQYKTWESHR